MACCMLTTVDNPYDPFDNFKEWNVFDVLAGYDCCGKLARLAKVSDSFTEEENAAEIERAIDRIVALDFTNKYKKVKREDEKNGFKSFVNLK